jgi:hypothetical protein
MQIDFKLFVRENMFCLKQVCVHWVNLMKKQIISKFQKLEILNQMVARENTHLLYYYASCL